MDERQAERIRQMLLGQRKVDPAVAIEAKGPHPAEQRADDERHAFHRRTPAKRQQMLVRLALLGAGEMAIAVSASRPQAAPASATRWASE